MTMPPLEIPRRLETLSPPEGTPISFEIASLGSRWGAQLLDLIITNVALIAILLFLAWSRILPWSAFMTALSLLAFLTRIPYYILAEMIWNGRTLGKRLVKIRVVSADGRRLTPYQIVARNLMRDAEVLTPMTLMAQAGGMGLFGGTISLLWVIATLSVPLFNRRRQRLGDMIAGTLVVEAPRPLLLEDLAATARVVSDRFDFEPAHLEIYGRYELQTLERILRDKATTHALQMEIHKVATTIINKIGYVERVPESEHQAFLLAFYRAQRDYLERRRLFGDRREDKLHAQTRKAAKEGKIGKS